MVKTSILDNYGLSILVEEIKKYAQYEISEAINEVKNYTDNEMDSLNSEILNNIATDDEVNIYLYGDDIT